MAKKWDQLKSEMSPEAQARVDERVKETIAAMPLAEIRKAIGLTQTQLAEILDMQQGSVSKIENSTDMYISTLRRVVAALGGRLVVTASFPEKGEYEISHLAFGTDAEGPAKQST